MLLFHLARAVDLDLEDDVAAGRRRGLRRAVVVAEEVRPLEESARVDVRFKLGARHEVVSVG